MCGGGEGRYEVMLDGYRPHLFTSKQVGLNPPAHVNRCHRSTTRYSWSEVAVGLGSNMGIEVLMVPIGCQMP